MSASGIHLHIYKEVFITEKEGGKGGLNRGSKHWDVKSLIAFQLDMALIQNTREESSA